MNIKDIYRSGHVKRWHIVNTHRQQTLAEHHYLVTMILFDIAPKIGLPLASDEGRVAVMWSLIHDLPEIFTGDMPTPMKMYLRGHMALNAYEGAEAGIDENYNLTKAMAKASLAYDLVKLCDIMEGILFLEAEAVDGSTPGTHSNQVRMGLIIGWEKKFKEVKEKYRSMKWSAIEHYLDDFRETIPRQLVPMEDSGYENL